MTRPIFVTLAPQRIIPRDILEFLWQLEAKGFHFLTLRDESSLLISPYDRLTPEEVEHLRTWRDDIVSLVRHCAADTPIEHLRDLDAWLKHDEAKHA